MNETLRGKRRHKLMTKEIAGKLPKLGETDKPGTDPMVHLKLFSSFGRYTFYVTEFDGEDTLFGYCLSPAGADLDELGYASFAELEQATVLGGVPAIERDCYWDAKPLSECEGVNKGGRW